MCAHEIFFCAQKIIYDLHLKNSSIAMCCGTNNRSNRYTAITICLCTNSPLAEVCIKQIPIEFIQLQFDRTQTNNCEYRFWLNRDAFVRSRKLIQHFCFNLFAFAYRSQPLNVYVTLFHFVYDNDLEHKQKTKPDFERSLFYFSQQPQRQQVRRLYFNRVRSHVIAYAFA